LSADGVSTKYLLTKILLAKCILVKMFVYQISIDQKVLSPSGMLAKHFSAVSNVGQMPIGQMFFDQKKWQ
jgi:hypothetical protein